MIPQLRPEEPAIEGNRFARLVWNWITAVTSRLNGPPELPEYTVARLPSASGTKRLVWVTDAGGGAIPAYSDGTDWRRITDGTVVS